MIDDFLLRAVLAGLVVAAVAGPLGCLVVWRRMAYFGATLAHGAILGVALGLFTGLPPGLSVLLVSAAAALALAGMERLRTLPVDTLLGMIAHAMLAFGLIAFAFLETVRVDLLGLLFGDILAVGWGDLAWTAAGGAVALAALALIWRALVAATVHRDLAAAEGLPVARTDLVFKLLLALTVALAMQVVGVLLTIALLLIPAAAARRVAGSPETMALGATAVGGLSVLGGLALSYVADIPAGPAIVAAATLLFIAAQLLPRRI